MVWILKVSPLYVLFTSYYREIVFWLTLFETLKYNFSIFKRSFEDKGKTELTLLFEKNSNGLQEKVFPNYI